MTERGWRRPERRGPGWPAGACWRRSARGACPRWGRTWAPGSRTPSRRRASRSSSGTLGLGRGGRRGRALMEGRAWAQVLQGARRPDRQQEQGVPGRRPQARPPPQPPTPQPPTPHVPTLPFDREASGARSKWALEQEIGSESDVLRLFLRAIKAQKPLGRWAPHPTPRPSRARLTPPCNQGTPALSSRPTRRLSGNTDVSTDCFATWMAV